MVNMKKLPFIKAKNIVFKKSEQAIVKNLGFPPESFAALFRVFGRQRRKSEWHAVKAKSIIL